MSRPRSADLEMLLREARGDVATRDEQRALLEALVARVGSGPPGGGGGPAAFPSDTARRRAGRSMVGLAAAVGGVAAVSVLVASFVSGPRLRPPGARAVAPEVPSLPAEAPPPAAVIPSSNPASAPAVAPLASASGAPLSSPPRSTSRTPDAPSEASLIERARDAVKGAPSRALALTNEHLRAWPDGQLASEREVIAIEALVRLGRREQAVARAATFRASHPGSIYGSRIAALLGEASEGGTP